MTNLRNRFPGRRRFLKQSAALSGAVALTASALSAPAADAAAGDGSQTGTAHDGARSDSPAVAPTATRGRRRTTGA